ncbi:MAG: VCBS repeat-containing protein [Bacteroidales bacterium]|nr:VCBS repeat-containing protein [Bacteroidales bacterium]
MTGKKLLILTMISFLVHDGQSQNFFSDEKIIYYSDTVVPASVYVCDPDTDGDADVLAAFYNEIYLYRNTDGKGTFAEGEIIVNLDGESTSIHAVDLDVDGDQDLIATVVNTDKLVWYENTDGKGLFGPQQVISTEVDRPWSVFASDIDADGDPDILSTSVFDEKIAWYENTDGLGNFGPQRIIQTSIPWPNAVRTADLNTNGYQDVFFVSGSYNDSRISWINNLDGKGTYDSMMDISEQAKGARFVDAADLDGDGDMDILSASIFDDKIAWYENTDGKGAFGPQKVISTLANGAVYVHAADLDGDGDQDVLSASNIDDKIAWYENRDGQGTFGPEQVIALNAWEAGFVHVTDVDNDGLPDVLSASIDFKIAWYKNTYPMMILENPSDTAILPEQNASMSVTANDVIDYQWQVDPGDGFSDLSENELYTGVNSHHLQFTDVPVEISGYRYRCVVSGVKGTLFSAGAILTVKDTISPVIQMAPGDQFLEADSACMALLPDFTGLVEAKDNRSEELYISQDPLPLLNTVTGISNPVTISVQDDAGNSTLTTFNVKVEDRTPPFILSQPSNQVLEPNVFGEVYMLDFRNLLVAGDNCSFPEQLSIVQSPAPYTDYSGVFADVEVTLTVSDAAGNSTVVVFTVTIPDLVKPVITCVKDQVRELVTGLTLYTIVGSEFDPVTVSDNDGISSLTNNLYQSTTLEGAFLHVGTTPITWTVTDHSGNQAHCSFDVIVEAYTGMDYSELDGISIYPNPTSGEIHIETSGLQIKRLRMMDARGVTIIEKNDTGVGGSLNLSHLSAGIYFCSITTVEGVVNCKLIKE